MIGEKFTLLQYSVSGILGLIDAGQFVIPEIQRPFVWKRSQVRDLIDSLYNGYPTGYIITWKNPDVKTKDGVVANGKHVLIDGQQRITALMAAISGLEVLDEDFNRDRIKIAFKQDDKKKGYKDMVDTKLYLMKATRAKGHEYDEVIVLGADEGGWPSTKTEDNEEERRLFYVALSRAKNFLYFCEIE